MLLNGCRSIIVIGSLLLFCANVSWAGKPPVITTPLYNIQQSSAILYETLLAFDEYSLWNPWIYEATGQRDVGGHVLAKLKLDGREVESDHIITDLIESQKFCWRDEMWYSFMAGGQRCRYLEQQPDGSTNIIGTFQFNGWFAGMGYLIYKKQMLDGMKAELQGLKIHAEHRSEIDLL